MFFNLPFNNPGDVWDEPSGPEFLNEREFLGEEPRFFGGVYAHPKCRAAKAKPRKAAKKPKAKKPKAKKQQGRVCRSKRDGRFMKCRKGQRRAV
jgi:hypothetical protein